MNVLWTGVSQGETRDVTAEESDPYSFPESAPAQKETQKFENQSTSVFLPQCDIKGGGAKRFRNPSVSVRTVRHQREVRQQRVTNQSPLRYSPVFRR